MNLPLDIIVKTILQKRFIPILIAMQIAFTMTVLTNGFSIIMERYQLVNRESGYALDRLFFIRSYVFDKSLNLKQLIFEEIDQLRSITGVSNVAPINFIPLSGNGTYIELKDEPIENYESEPIAMFSANENTIKTLGLDLIAGRNFTSNEVLYPFEDVTDNGLNIITSASAAQTLFPNTPYEEVIGKVKYDSNLHPIRIIGIVKNLHASWVYWEGLENTALYPKYHELPYITYAIETEPENMSKTMEDVFETLSRSNSGKIVEEMITLKTVHEQSYLEHTGLINTLLLTISGVMIITLFGIIGLSNFTIDKRRKQIGIRRALGATKYDIVKYFITENIVISLIGVTIGVLFSYTLNYLLVDNLNIKILDGYFILIAIITLLITGIIGVLWPALKAAQTSPAVATKQS